MVRQPSPRPFFLSVIRRSRPYYLGALAAILLATTPAERLWSQTTHDTPRSESLVAQRAKAAWEQGTLDLALDILEQGGDAEEFLEYLAKIKTDKITFFITL